ncbi:hypothetical protein [Flagellimonas pacifica]|uniref:DUF1579 domain-containing protein n=1 Tax=Flagellimonas pacifica TaxID=1247520 RepID=A0A285MTC1_9FLAO|nr:hypothetical protein [Allomuricauda parva]SNY99933.1 hypothetical protein SAMN06265377_1748 [Allomuricauda parva]
MKHIISVLLLTFVPLLLSAQETNPKEHSFFTPLIDKEWTGNGILMGKDATFIMNWERLWEGKFIKLQFQNNQKLEDNNEIIFMATAYYQIVNEMDVRGHWFDSRGISFPLRGTIDKNTMTILWGNEDTEQGKTVYHHQRDSDNVTVEDFILNKGEYFKFGSATYTINKG